MKFANTFLLGKVASKMRGDLNWIGGHIMSTIASFSHSFFRESERSDGIGFMVTDVDIGWALSS